MWRLLLVLAMMILLLVVALEGPAALAQPAPGPSCTGLNQAQAAQGANPTLQDLFHSNEANEAKSQGC